MKKVLSLVLVLVMCMSLSACTTGVNMSADLEPKDFDDLILVPLEDALEAMSLTEGDFLDDVKVNGIHEANIKPTLCGREWTFYLQVWNDKAQDYIFIDRRPLDDSGLQSYYDLVDKLTELYGEPVDPSTYGVIDFGEGIEYEVAKWAFEGWLISTSGMANSEDDEPYLLVDLYISPNLDIVRDGIEFKALE